jgi:hypothetical protein
MKTIFTLIIFSAFVSGYVINGQETEYRKFPVNVSFVYPASIHGTRSVNYEYDFSLNMLTGLTGSIDGCEIGGLVNLNKGDVSGFQVAGIGNITGGYIDGAQIGGIFSMADSVDGLQVGGIFSKCGKAQGLQIGGLVNLSATSEAAIAGIANINSGNQDGIQIAGIYNQAKEVNGVQIGLINFADTIRKGVPIGLISIVRKGHYHEYEFAIADYLNLGISYKLGLKQFYTIYTAGMSLAKDQLWVAGLGFGQLHEVNPRFSIQPELVWYYYFPMDMQRQYRDTHVTHFKLGLVRNLSQNLAISLAPSIYVSWKHKPYNRDEYGYEQSPVGPLFDVDSYDHNRIGIGFGLSAGIHLR